MTQSVARPPHEAAVVASEPGRSQLAPAQRAYDEGRFRESHRLLVGAVGPLRDAVDPDSRVLALRLAARLGAQRLSSAFAFYTHRGHPTHGPAAFYYASLIMGRRGPYPALRWMQAHDLAHGALGGDTPAVFQASWQALRAIGLGYLRDYEAATEVMQRANALADDAWVALQGARVLELADRTEEATETVEAILERWPAHAGARLTQAHLLCAAERADEALELLGTVRPTVEDYGLCSYAADVAVQVDQHAKADDWVTRAAAVAILAEPALKKAFAAQEAEVAHARGDFARAARRARDSDTDFGREFAARLEASPAPLAERRVLDVPFVRQHHVTCVPASMASIAAYYGEVVDHRALADEICYGGTPARAEREWAEANGYYAREFDVTAEVLEELIGRGHPFGLTTTSTVGGHVQVVAGYDRVRATVLLRDPGHPFLVEHKLAPLLEREDWAGPRGMTLVPTARAAEVSNIEFPAADAWDRIYELEQAIHSHDREAGEAALEALRQAAPGHRLVLHGEALFARYRGDAQGEIEAADSLAERYPKAGRPRLMRAEAMFANHDRAARLAYFEDNASGDPALLEMWAEDLRSEASQRPRAELLLRRAIRCSPSSGMALHVLADLMASAKRPEDEVLELFRFAACLAPTHEHFAQAYYYYARTVGRGDEALRHLETRVDQAFGRSGLPAVTLYSILRSLGRVDHGLSALERCARERPDDGPLALDCANALLAAGELERAAEWLGRAKGRSRRARFLAAEATLVLSRGDLDGAITRLKESARVDAWDAVVHARIASLLTERDGPEAAITHLEAALEAQPDHPDVLVLLVERLRDVDEARAQEMLEARLARQPQDVWARRELALVLQQRGQPAEALAQADEAVEWAPNDTVGWSVRAMLRWSANDGDGARADVSRALELAVDNGNAHRLMVDYALDAEARREAVRTSFRALLGGVSVGPGLAAFSGISIELEPDERLTRARELWEHYRDVPEAWEVYARALADGGDLDRAAELADEACGQFPSADQAMQMRAGIAYLARDFEAEERAYRALVAMRPVAPGPRVQLVGALRDAGRLDEAQVALDEGLARAPRDVGLHSERAKLLHRAGDLEGAYGALERAFELSPRFADFNLWLSASDAIGQPDRPIRFVESLLAKKPDEAILHQRLAEALYHPADLDRRVDALREVLRLQPRAMSSADLAAQLLGEVGRIAEARSFCPPAGWTGPVPTSCQGRAAWLLAQDGQLDRAIEEMQEILEDTPGYAWGLSQLTSWLQKKGDVRASIALARRQVERFPHDAGAHSSLADVLLQTGDMFGATKALDAALHLAPGSTWAANERVGIAFQRTDLDSVERLLERIGPHQPPGDVAAWRVEVLARRGRVGALDEPLEVLLSSPSTPGNLSAALTALEAAGQGVRTNDRLREAFESPKPVDQRLAQGWLLYVGRRPWLLSDLLRQSAHFGPSGRHAAALAIEELAKTRRRIRLISLWLFHRKKLQVVELWGAFGFALYELGWPRLCLRWLADFTWKSGRRPWMVLNFVLSKWSVGLWRHTPVAARNALALTTDHSRGSLLGWAALELALSGQTAEAKEHLAEAGRPATEYLAVLADLTHEVLALDELTRPRLGDISQRLAPYAGRVRVHDDSALRGALAAVRDHAALKLPWWFRKLGRFLLVWL